MNKLLQFVLLLAIIFFSKETLNAQGVSNFKKHRYTSIGVAINAMNYVGDLDPGPSFLSPGIKFTRANITLSYIKRLAPRYSFRGAVSWGRLKGNDFQNANFSDKNINRKFRNLSFRSDIIELKADIIIDLWENRGRYTKRPDYTPYFFTGLAYFHMNPKAYYQGSWVALQPLQTEGKSYSLNQIAIPVGLGFRYKLGKQWDLAFEMGWRFTFTDYIDDVSGNYVDKASFGNNQTAIDLSDRSGELVTNTSMDSYVAAQGGYQVDPYSSSGYHINGYGQAGNQRGDKRKDWYIVTGFHLSYIIPGRVICPKFRTQYNELQKKLLANNN